MKDKQDKDIKCLSEYIVALEREIQLGNNIQVNMEKIEQITENLSLEAMLQLDDYIQNNKLLEKKGE